MKFDRNTVLGFTILAVLFIGYFYYTSKEQSAYREKAAKEQHIKDSINLANSPKPDSLTLAKDSVHADSMNKISKAGNFQGGIQGTEQLVTLENDLMRVTLSSKGGQPKMVELKKFKGRDSSWVRMGGTSFDKISYTINTSGNSTAPTSELFFPGIDSVKNADGSRSVSFTLHSSDSASATAIVHTYTIKPGDYMIGFDVKLKGADKLLTQGSMNLLWQYAATQQESDLQYERTNTQMGFVENGDFDYYTVGKRSSTDFNKPVNWIGLRQRFFFGILVAKNNFTSGNMMWTLPADTAHTVAQSTATMRLQVPAGAETTIPFDLYYGPSEYHTLSQYNLKFEKLVNLGQGMYAFVRPINRYLIMPVFDMLKSATGNMGIAIALLTLVIRLLTSPLIYKSYVSGAKMKALRPEIAKLKDKYGEDRQGMSMEQMKLFREAGVNPLGGCIPALLQIPIFFALFSLFSADIALRGSSFLWSHDLAAYDAPIRFGVNIPLLGDHLSLFNIAAVATSFLISLYSMSMTPDQGNPMMKYLPYIFPVFLLLFFNRLPSALTWYYTVSNSITLILQIIIQRYIIDHDKILAQIEQNRKKPKTKSKWQERFEQMQEQQKKVKEMQQRGKR